MTVHRSSKRRGFTLIELLVVIAIIAVLASLSFVGGRKALLASRAAVTQENLRQVHQVILDLKVSGLRGSGTLLPGRYPGYAGNVGPDGGGWVSYNWMDLVGQQLDYAVFQPGTIRWEVDPAETILQNPLSRFKLGRKGGELQDNPRPEGETGYGGFTYSNQVGEWLHANAATATKQNRGSKNDADFPYPSTTILLTESNDDSPQHALATWSGKVGQGNYKDRCYCLFLDGHVESIPNDILRSQAGWQKYFVADGPGKLKNQSEL